MDESKQIIKEKFESLPKALQDYVKSDVWGAKVAQICAQNNVPDENKVAIENEVFFVLIGLEPSKDLKENIIRETGLADDTVRRVTDTVNGSVLSPVMSYIKDLWREEVVAPIAHSESKVGDSFAQAIVNQAKAMQPIGNNSSKGEVVSSRGQIPNNLPIEGYSSTQPSYQPGTDPYREPLE